jgi:hypothetical protein
MNKVLMRWSRSQSGIGKHDPSDVSGVWQRFFSQESAVNGHEIRMMRKGVKKLQALDVCICGETDPHPTLDFFPVVKLPYVLLISDTGRQLGIVSDPPVRPADRENLQPQLPQYVFGKQVSEVQITFFFGPFLERLRIFLYVR